jgi:hypothetical protein
MKRPCDNHQTNPRNSTEYRGIPKFSPYGSVCCACAQRPGLPRVSLRLARLPRTANSAQRSRRLRSKRTAVPVHLAHAEVITNTLLFQWVQNLGAPRKQQHRTSSSSCATCDACSSCCLHAALPASTIRRCSEVASTNSRAQRILYTMPSRLKDWACICKCNTCAHIPSHCSSQNNTVRCTSCYR